MESGFEDDFAPMQSSAGKPATIDDDSLILGDEDDSPKKTSEGKMRLGAKAFTSLQHYVTCKLLPKKLQNVSKLKLDWFIWRAKVSSNLV